MSTGVSLKEFVKPRRRCGVAILLRNKTNHNKYMTIGALCGSWKCPACGPYLKQKWVDHLTYKLMSLDQIYISVIPDKSGWDTISKRIQRARGQYAIVERSDKRLVVFTTVPQGELISSKAVALSKLEKAIREATDCRPIHTSRGWALTKTSPKLGTWERVSRLPISVDDAKRVTEAVGLQVSTFFADYRTGFTVELSSDWAGEDGLKYLLLLRGGSGAH